MRLERESVCSHLVFIAWLLLLSSPLNAQSRRVGLLSIDPAAIYPRSSTNVTISTLITADGYDVIKESVNVLRVDSSGRTLSILGRLNDDGQNGDSIAGDGIYTVIISFNENSPGTIYLRVSAAFRGTLQRTLSEICAVKISPMDIPIKPKPLNINNIISDSASESNLVCNELLVKFKDNVSYDEIRAVVAGVSARISGSMPALNTYQIEISTCGIFGIESARSILTSNPIVESVDINWINKELQSSFIPNDPRLLDQWGIARTRVPNAWSIIQKGAAIGVIDTGINYDHEDLAGQVIPGMDLCDSIDIFGNCSIDYDPRDNRGHGTAVAGIAAAVTNNATGVAGMAFRAPIIVEKIYGPFGGAADSDIATAIVDAIIRGARVINLSLGDYRDTPFKQKIIQYAVQRRCVVVASAGNDNKNGTKYPASYAGVIAVGASDINNDRAIWSTNLGGHCAGLEDNMASNYGPRIDVYAPGTDILVLSHDDNKGYKNYCGGGTSFAAPFVTGTAALILARNPSLTPERVRSIIMDTASATGKYDPNGIPIRVLDSFAAVQEAERPVLSSITVTFSGIVAAVVAPISNVVSEGSILSGSFTFNPATPEYWSQCCTLVMKNSGIYSAITSMSFKIGNYSGSGRSGPFDRGSGTGSIIAVSNNDPTIWGGWWDRYAIYITDPYLTGASIEGYTPVSLLIDMYDTTLLALNSEALPLTDDFITRFPSIAKSFYLSFGNGPDGLSVGVWGRITSMSYSNP